MGLFYVFVTIFFTVYGQLILKWRVSLHGEMPEGMSGKICFTWHLLFDPFVLSGFAAAFIASIFWMAAISKLQLSYAYPFMSLAFILVLFLSGLIFNEPITWPKITGMFIIVVGIIIGSQG
jgi:multidrug transporter EmrE-like cation transporter